MTDIQITQTEDGYLIKTDTVTLEVWRDGGAYLVGVRDEEWVIGTADAVQLLVDGLVAALQIVNSAPTEEVIDDRE